MSREEKFLVAVDLQKAFDSVQTVFVWEALADIGIDGDALFQGGLPRGRGLGVKGAYRLQGDIAIGIKGGRVLSFLTKAEFIRTGALNKDPSDR